MSRRRALVTQADVVRSIKAVRASGIKDERITGVKITPEGVLVLIGDPPRGQGGEPVNEWDEVLSR